MSGEIISASALITIGVGLITAGVNEVPVSLAGGIAGIVSGAALVLVGVYLAQKGILSEVVKKLSLKK